MQALALQAICNASWNSTHTPKSPVALWAINLSPLCVALATSWINAGQALRRAQDIGLHVRGGSHDLTTTCVNLTMGACFVAIAEEASTPFSSERDQKASLVVCVWARSRFVDGPWSAKWN